MDGVIIGSIIALVGILISIVLAFMVPMLSGINAIKEELKQVKLNADKSEVLPPQLSFLTYLAREAKFWEKLNIKRAEKTQIANTIAFKYIRDKDIIILDSGTTIDQIPQKLKERKLEITVYTNNLLAAISVVPATEGEKFKCILLPGKIDPHYGATYLVSGDIEEYLEKIPATQIILAASAISYEEGPMVGENDPDNLRFKKALIEKALGSNTTCQSLSIAVDDAKLIKSLATGIRHELRPVLENKIWKKVLANHRFVLFTTEPSDEMQTPDAIRSKDIIQLFKVNMDKGRMQIKICNNH